MNFASLKPLQTSLLCLLPPLLTVLLSMLLFELFIFDFNEKSVALNTFLAEKPVQTHSATNYQELKGRLLWISSVLLYLFINAGFIVYLVDILKNYSGQYLKLLVSITATLFLLQLIYLVLSPAELSPIKTIFHFTYDALTTSKVLSDTSLKFVFLLLAIINIFALLIVPLIMIAGISLLSNLPQTSMEIETRIKALTGVTQGASAINGSRYHAHATVVKLAAGIEFRI